MKSPAKSWSEVISQCPISLGQNCLPKNTTRQIKLQDLGDDPSHKKKLEQIYIKSATLHSQHHTSK